MKVLKIGASWCSGCKVMKPRWEEIEKENPWLETEFILVDEHPEIMKEYQIESLPTFIFLDKEGKEIERVSGIIEKEKILELIEKYRDR